MQPEILSQAPRCGAKTRSGRPCLSPAVRGRKRCRMHGGATRGAGAPKGNRNAFVHGNRTAEAEEQLKQIAANNRDLKLITKLNSGLKLTTKEQERWLALYLERCSRP